MGSSTVLVYNTISSKHLAASNIQQTSMRSRSSMSAMPQYPTLPAQAYFPFLPAREASRETVEACSCHCLSRHVAATTVRYNAKPNSQHTTTTSSPYQTYFQTPGTITAGKRNHPNKALCSCRTRTSGSTHPWQTARPRRSVNNCNNYRA
jgi:hypothetical protein